MSRKRARNALPVICLLLAAAVAGCAGSPSELAERDATQIQTAEAKDLCYPYAFNKEHGEVQPVIENEVKRRGLGCRHELDTVVSDCGPLTIVGAENHPQYDNVTLYSVRNDATTTKNFRIASGNLLSSKMTIGPTATQSYGVVARPSSATAASILGAVQGTTDAGPWLQNCVTAS